MVWRVWWTRVVDACDERAETRCVVAVSRGAMVAVAVAGVRRTMIEGIGATEKQIQSLSNASMERIASMSHRSAYSRGCACRTPMADVDLGRWGGVGPRTQGCDRTRYDTIEARGYLLRAPARDAYDFGRRAPSISFSLPPTSSTFMNSFSNQTGSRWLAGSRNIRT